MEKIILWIDKNMNTFDNKSTLEYFKVNLKNFSIKTFESVSYAFKEIKNNKNIYEFNLFYVIVSGSLAEEFFTVYAKETQKINIIAATIVYCFNQKYHENKPYYLDPFLNPGKITNNAQTVVEYILKDECDWKNRMGINLIANKEEYNIQDKKKVMEIFSILLIHLRKFVILF